MKYFLSKDNIYRTVKTLSVEKKTESVLSFQFSLTRCTNHLKVCKFSGKITEAELESRV